MGKIAFIFPGQGSQFVGMGKDLFDNSESAKNIYNKFNEVLGKDLTSICFEGPEENLKQTINTQPAILATSIAAYETLQENLKTKPDFLAGHSLGEYGALYVSGVLSLEDTIKLIGKRAELMSKAQSGGMAAVLGLAEEKLTEALEQASSEGTVTVANYNTPDQIVITGEENAVKTASELCSQAGAKRVVPLAVSGAFHSPLMKEAAQQYAEFVKTINVNNGNIPVITNVDASATTSADEFKSKMSDQIYSSVYWTQTIAYMIEQGVDTFVEIGPGKVLAGMNKKMAKDAKTYNVSDIESANAVAQALNESLEAV